MALAHSQNDNGVSVTSEATLQQPKTIDDDDAAIAEGVLPRQSQTIDHTVARLLRYSEKVVARLTTGID